MQSPVKMRLKGMKIRDEFICPITTELLRDPVIATDGHTYERQAIEKWLKRGNISPRTGGVIESRIISNMNLKKIIQDILNEGGAGLYSHDKDSNSQGRLIEVSAQKTLVLRCLGPPESEWHQQSFQVTRHGCIGGRKLQIPVDIDQDSREHVWFQNDTTVSRKHFQISYNRGIYELKDLGSAGGTFVKIPFGEKKQLHIGMMILIGKHQFTVSSIADEQPDTIDHIIASVGSTRAAADDDAAWIQAAQQLVKEISAASTFSPQKEDIEERLKQLNLELKQRKERMSRCDKGTKRDFEEMEIGGGFTSGIAEPKQGALSGRYDAKQAVKKQCTLTCFLPDGSPLQGKSFVVTESGVSIGRSLSNGISLQVQHEEKSINVDVAVSSEHSKIVFDSEEDSFYIADGGSKPSTNGTWYRLSGPQQESCTIPLKETMELLFGTIRFQVGQAMSILEKDVDTETEVDFVAAGSRRQQQQDEAGPPLADIEVKQESSAPMLKDELRRLRMRAMGKENSP